MSIFSPQTTRRGQSNQKLGRRGIVSESHDGLWRAHLYTFIGGSCLFRFLVIESEGKRCLHQSWRNALGQQRKGCSGLSSAPAHSCHRPTFTRLQKGRLGTASSLQSSPEVRHKDVGYLPEPFPSMVNDLQTPSLKTLYPECIISILQMRILRLREGSYTWSNSL